MSTKLIAALDAVAGRRDRVSARQGLQRRRRDRAHRDTDTSTMRGTDDCPMCEGVQHARADGTCPQCGMKVKAAAK